jgi:putative DNA primase/helicase
MPVQIITEEGAQHTNEQSEDIVVKSLAGGSNYLIRTKKCGSGVYYLAPAKTGGDNETEQMQEFIDRFIKESVPEEADGQVKRIAGRFALVACGGELATSLGITGWKPGTALHDARFLFDRWLNDRGNIGQGEDQKLIAKIRKFFELHGESRFASIDSISDNRLVTNRVGFKEVAREEYLNPETGKCETRNQYVYFVMSEGFKEICEGFNHKQASKKLLKHGILLPNSEGKAMHSKRLPGFASPKKVYVFTHRIIEDSDETGKTESSTSGKGTEDTKVQTA